MKTTQKTLGQNLKNEQTNQWREDEKKAESIR